MRRRRLGSKEERLQIADAIRNFLVKNGYDRKFLVGHEKHLLSNSTVNKVFQGDFSETTLIKIENILQTTFRPEDDRAGAPKEIGGYKFDSVVEMQGEYLCVRPRFDGSANLNAYLVHIYWDKVQERLLFEERSRSDPQYTQTGTVYVTVGAPFIVLVTIHLGNVRTVLLSFPGRDGLARGIITTLSNPQGSMYIPVAAPIILQRLKATDKPATGFITPDSPAYAEYRKALVSVTAEGFGILVTSPDRTL